jgi:hypothetical protein
VLCWKSPYLLNILFFNDSKIWCKGTFFINTQKHIKVFF